MMMFVQRQENVIGKYRLTWVLRWWHDGGMCLFSMATSDTIEHQVDDVQTIESVLIHPRAIKSACHCFKLQLQPQTFYATTCQLNTVDFWTKRA